MRMLLSAAVTCLALSAVAETVSPEVAAARQKIDAEFDRCELKALSVGLSRGGKTVFTYVRESQAVVTNDVAWTADGQTHYKKAEKETKPFDADTPLETASVTKTVTAMLALQLVSEGKMSLGDKLVKYIPEYPDPEVTVVNLLTHTSGLRGKGMIDWNRKGAFYSAMYREFPRETKFNYFSTGYDIVVDLIERVSGAANMTGYAKARIFSKLGMNHTSMGLHVGQVGMKTTVGDMLLLGNEILTVNRTGRPGKAFDVETVRLMLTPVLRPEFFRTPAFFVNNGKGRGFCQDFVEANTPKAVGHGGSSGCYFMVDPGVDAVGVILSRSPKAKIHILPNGYRNVFRAMFAATACCADDKAGEIRVSPDGLSPVQALEKIRAAKAAGDKSAWTVRVAPGLYELKRPLVFTPADSGTPTAPVRWIADRKGEAVFAGGGRVTGWRDDGDGTWSAPLPKDADGRTVWFQSLYANGRRAVRARHPNTGFFHVDAWHQTAVTNADGSVTYTQHAVVKDGAADALTGLAADERAAVELQSRVKWSYGAYSVTGWDVGSRTLTVCTYADRMVEWKEWPGKDNLFCLENVRAGFDAPGEWFYDVTAGRLRYRPRPGETLESFEAVAPTAGLPSVVVFDGDPKAGKTVTDISFEGIAFELSTTRGHRLPSGFVQQYQWQAAAKAGGCLFAKGAERISFEKCRVAHTENYAIRMDVGCVSNRVVGCELTDLGAGGVLIGDMRANYYSFPGKHNARMPYPGRPIPYGDPVAAPFHPCAFITVDDCTIADAGLVNPEGCGVLITQASDCSVTHCDIHDLYYTGVSVGWTWGYSGSLSQRNTVAFNHIRDIGKGIMSDMGGVYTLGTSFGTCVSNNVIHGIRSLTYGGWGLYNDEGSEGIVWENNLVYDAKDAGYHQHYGRNNVVRNNIFAGAEKAQLAVSLAEAHTSVDFERNIVRWEGEAPLFAGPSYSFRVVDGKEYLRPVDPVKNPAEPIIGWKTNLFWCATGPTVLKNVRNAVVADPLFVDAKAGDYRLKSDSPAFGIGFKPWDFTKAGRR